MTTYLGTVTLYPDAKLGVTSESKAIQLKFHHLDRLQDRVGKRWTNLTTISKKQGSQSPT